METAIYVKLTLTLLFILCIMPTIYVLRLKGGKYYVGKAENVERRFQEHVSGSGASWTRIHKPIAIEKTIQNASAFDEDKITKEYMAKHGIDNVRGGTYVTNVLDENQMESLNQEIWQAKGLCTQCGRAGHFVRDCHAKSDINGYRIEYEDESSDESDSSEETPYRAGKCYRCGREGHYSPDCFASRHIKGYTLY